VKPELLLLHGWNMSPAVMLPLARSLTANFKVTLAVMPGYPIPAETELRLAGVCVATTANATPATDCGVSKDPLNWLVKLLTDQAPAKAHWVGWSLGATLAMAAAQQSADRIESMVLISPTPSFVIRNDWPHGFEKSTFERLLRLTTKRFPIGTKQFLKLQGPKLPDETFAANLATLLQQPPTDEALQTGFDILCDTDLRPSLKDLQTPAKIIAASQDSIIPPTASQYIAACLPNASLTTIGSGHALPLSHPQMLANTIANFVGEKSR
jgi:pimeloyl-[acyl-carrier protein] methyl ester esterase